MDGSTQREEIEQHLLFHKAMTESSESFNRINGYMDILSAAGSGERLNDPVDESIRAVFSLVLENGIDPWEIDLGEFVKMYSRKVMDNTFDMIVAGKLILMAWKILRMQSDATRNRVDDPVEDVIESDFDLEDEDERMFVPEVTFNAAYQRDTVRPVTMCELLNAFEDARAEVEVQQERERVRTELRARAPRKFENKAHDEDDERDVEKVWGRIEGLGGGAFCINRLYAGDVGEDLRIFVSVLHLVREGRLSVWQESLPYGDIHLEIRHPETADASEESAAVI